MRFLNPSVIKVVFLALGVLPFSPCNLHAKSPAPTPVAASPGGPFTPEQSGSGFIKDFQRWAAEDEGKLPQPAAVLAIGSSSMRMWKSIAQDLAPATIIHRGFGGSTMKDVVLMQSFFDRYGCQKILLYEGDNDLSKDDSNVDADFLDHLKSFIAGIRKNHPDTEFYLMSIKYSPRRVSRIPAYAQANKAMAEMAGADQKIHFIDTNSPMLGGNELPREDLFKNDYLHMNEKGYAIWKDAVRAALLNEKK